MSKKPPFPPKLIEVVLFPEFQLLDAAGPIGAFEIASRFKPGAYTLKLSAPEAGLIPSSSGARMPAQKLSRARADTILVVGGQGTADAMRDAAMIAAIKHAPQRARRVASVCSGAFILAAAGLLDGKTCTTHWRQAQRLAAAFPNVRVEPDRIHVQDGAIWTSAGVTAGIDLALAMIEADLGADVAADVAREMVVYAKRPGGQAQHSALLDLDAPRFAALNTWMRDHLANDLSVEKLAARAAMSPRTFARAYAAETGVTPAKAVERLRVEAARAALARGGGVQEIAQRTGFGDPERMRRAFVRLYGTPPAALRRTLRSA
ncbi:GlxA family transcriptional regulator [Terricaulis sp.]|uniref:GlxA family transcriptional regulator n=1 Tax=Terricaulis sp. TaxID=2768686 RepID=UPI002AC3D046|nr:GlxA family transcriptional regulator [Terricaulis sp.]MDZ4693145.1 GlxA family transcriptional regulator [Terricaulis sp.]